MHNEMQAAYMLAYSPLDNVRPQAYPHMLASGGAHYHWFIQALRLKHPSWNS